MDFLLGLLVVFILYIIKFKDDLNKEKADTLLGGLSIVIGIVVVINVILLFI